MKLFIDGASVMWTCLRAGKDVEGKEVNHNGKNVWVNSAAYGYENVVNNVVNTLNKFNVTPKDCVFVLEGKDSKKRRCMIDPLYKGGSSKPAEMFIQFNLLKEKVVEVFRGLGAIFVVQDFVEGDDVLAWLAQNTEEDVVIVTGDNDLIVLNGVNGYGATVTVSVSGVVGENKYGGFDFKLVTLYKSLVGDSSDNIKGCPGFGPAAFLNLVGRYGEDGCFELLDLIRGGRRDDLASLAAENSCKFLSKIVEQWESVVKSYKMVLLHPEWVNTVRMGLNWMPGMVGLCDDERLRNWKAQTRLVTADNYEKALGFFRSKVNESEFVTIDFETTVTEESDMWLETRDKKGVDVIGSRIVSMGLSFGSNSQYGYYVSVEHADTNNCTLEQLAVLLESIPKDKFVVAHNAAGFELVVAYNAFADKWKENGWRGFIPNMVDTRIAASFWDENQPSHGLKNLSKLLLNYQQGTYEETTCKTGPVGTLKSGTILKQFDVDGVATETRQYKMHELTAAEVVGYGVDDVFTASGLWNFFKLFMQLDHTYEAFCRLEQKPMYLSALAYVQGLDIDMPRLKVLEKQDKELQDKCWTELESFLITKGWDGVTCPVFTELTAANIKQAVEIVLGQELKSAVRTPSKLATLIGQIDHEDAETLAQFVAEDRVDLVNQMVKTRYTGKPNFNIGSPNQVSKLLYEVVGMPVRLRNKATEAMRAKGMKQGNPRTDDAAIELAIKFKDVDEAGASLLTSMLSMKSCNTRNSLYWSAYPSMLHWKTGKIHPELRQSSTNTRRWASGSPNIQQLQSDYGGVRSVIKAEPGFIFCSLDFSSQEVRQLADYSQDPALLSCYIGDHKRDTHSIVGAKVAGVSYEEFMSMRKSEDKDVADRAAAIRQISKIVLFSSIYGAAAPKVAETLGIAEQEAQGYIDAIYTEFALVKTWKDNSEKMAEQLGYVTLAGGTKRHLAKLITSEDKFEASKALRQSGNARIQGAGANQVKQVMTSVWDSDLLDRTSLKWKFVIHDEICYTCSKEEVVYVTEQLHKMMTQKFLDTVPSESSVGLGLDYGRLVELEKPFAKLGVQFDAKTVQETVDNLFLEKTCPTST